MLSKESKTIATFSFGGLISGVLSVSLNPWVIWFGAGFLFALSLVTSSIVAKRNRWLSRTVPVRNYLMAALILILAYPIAFLLTFYVAFAYYWLLQSFLRDRLSRIGSADEGVFIGLVFAAVLSSLALSLSMTVLTRVWSHKVALFIVIGGLATIPLAWTASRIFYTIEAFWPHWLLILGQSVFGSLSGYWYVAVNNPDKMDE